MTSPSALARLVEDTQRFRDSVVQAGLLRQTMGVYELDQSLNAARDALAAVAQAEPEPSDEQEIGAEFLKAIKQNQPTTHWDQSPVEVYTRLIDDLTAAREAIRLAKEMLDEVDDSTLAALWPERIERWGTLPAVQAALKAKP